MPMEGRGSGFDEMLAEISAFWAGEEAATPAASART